MVAGLTRALSARNCLIFYFLPQVKEPTSVLLKQAQDTTPRTAAAITPHAVRRRAVQLALAWTRRSCSPCLCELRRTLFFPLVL